MLLLCLVFDSRVLAGAWGRELRVQGLGRGRSGILMKLAFPPAQTLAEAFAPCLSPARAEEAVKKFDPAFSTAWLRYESGPLRAVHLSRHKWPGD